MTSPGSSSFRASDEATIDDQAELGLLKAELAAVQAELRASREAQERNHSALCAIADGIAIVDTAGCVTCLNPVASHLTGWREEACLGRPLGNVVQFTDHHGRSIDVLAEGFSSDLEASVSLVRRDGHCILVDGAVSPVEGRDKRPLGAVVTFRNVTASTRMARELAYHANHDPLTGLQNRRAFRAQLQRAIGNAGKFHNGNALLYLDLDRFKAVNDGGGHRAGDELLRRLAVLVRKQLREHDTVARLGGDEFAVLLENCTAKGAAHVAGKIRDAVAALAFSWGGREFRIGASIGLVTFDDGNRTVEQLMATADSLCYAAKDAGRDRVAIHDPAGPRTLPGAHAASSRRDGRRQDVAGA
ncbi:diguanylate cyclase [Luteimonas sp. 50]|uniref:Diguanylate cyclase n=1 Tax=Cognatiluteimonas sedimenti TaxID=2927791 RepID=A0ABT0A722_9GAMM|nr:diguanylate cyclase [Lysobacter sedimenti]MCJ0826779.1 diguanylate cyclase [Lysobacter sedimenti]